MNISTETRLVPNEKLAPNQNPPPAASILASNQPPVGEIAHWIIARTQPNRESYAALHIPDHHGVPTYLPRYETRRHGKLTGRERVLFPSYLLIDVGCRCGQWQFLLGAWGVVGVLTRSDGFPARLPDRVVRELRARENGKGLVELPRERFRPGQPVRVVGGLLRGFGAVGLYQGLGPAGRIRVLLQSLGTALLPESQVEGII